MMIQNDKTKYPKSMIIDWTKEFVPGTNFGFLFRKAKKNIRTFWQNQRCFEQLNRISNDDECWWWWWWYRPMFHENIFVFCLVFYWIGLNEMRLVDGGVCWNIFFFFFKRLTKQNSLSLSLLWSFWMMLLLDRCWIDDDGNGILVYRIWWW